MTIEAWYMDASEADQRLQHRQEPNVPVSSEELNALGVLQWSLTGSEDDAELAKIREARGYSYKDVVDIHKDRMPGYETKLKTFFEEHIHTDEEIRYILDGSGYFDVRDKDDKWIRVSMSKGDMIVLPAGIYHRFTLDDKNYIKACRLFVGVPVWTPHNRSESTDVMPERTGYVVDLTSGAIGAADSTDAASAAEKRPAEADAETGKKPKPAEEAEGTADAAAAAASSADA